MHYCFVIFSVMVLFSLISVAFLTLLERKLLGYLQLRKGPDKVGIQGVFQPFSDAVKLFSKEFFIPLNVNFYPYWVSPVIALFLSVILWASFPYLYCVMSWYYSILFIFSILSVSVYSIMIAGWSSNSCYSILGCIRSIAQSISYEVSFFLMFLGLMYFSLSIKLVEFHLIQKCIGMIVYCFPIYLMLFVSFLAELNRTPFDFSEGESELVSGFNIEYGGVGFAFIFLSEYLSILFSSMLLTFIFLSSSYGFFFFICLVGTSLLIIIIRGSLPRYRYDKLMNMCWKSYLTTILNLMIFYSSMIMI
uniref:NADH-ubiquinone oxidoreductase chain 1 n=1 Tax=Agonoscena pistaciae TaxID=1635299 RepID=A0A8F2Q437_9HEMI|nr:NADH dehydrogenase subunit 1 [Agonoscena pistaciae]